MQKQVVQPYELNGIEKPFHTQTVLKNQGRDEKSAFSVFLAYSQTCLSWTDGEENTSDLSSGRAVISVDWSRDCDCERKVQHWLMVRYPIVALLSCHWNSQVPLFPL